MKRVLLLVLATLASALTLTSTAWAQTGGPVVLMGIDAEDFPFSHGPAATYTQLVNNILAQTTKAAPEVVIVGCKAGTDTGNFWTAVFPAHRCVAGGAAILAETFLTAKLVIVVSDEINTPFGGLTCQDEDPALDDTSTQTELAAHVNAGGGLLGLTSDCPRPFEYISGVAPVNVSFPPQFDNIDPTTEGQALGVNDTLDVCCWHDVFTSFPSFLRPLAYRAGTQDAAAIGGREVVVPPPVREPTTAQLTPKRAENVVDTDHTVNVLITDQFGNTMEGVKVTFQVTGASGTIVQIDTTDNTGTATLTYHGPALPGMDTIVACVEKDDQPGCGPTDQPSDSGQKTWVLPVSTPNCAVDMNKETGGGQIVAANGDKFAFGGNAQVGPQGDTIGEQEAHDFGPHEEFTFHGKVVAVVCTAANPTTGQPGRATIFAFGEHDNSVTGLARIDVEDWREPGSSSTAPQDRYRYRKSGYDTELQPLKSGNIQIHS